MISYVWQNGRYSMFDISFMNGLKKLASVIPFNVHYIRALRETEFEKEDLGLNYARRMLGSLKLFNSFVGRKTPL